LDVHQERNLVRRLGERDGGAFTELVGIYQHQVYDLVYRMLGSREEADDVAQEVFVTVGASVGTYGGECRLSTWVFRICNDHCRRRIKSSARRPARDRRAGSPAAGQVERLAQQAFMDLDEDQRAVIVLRDVKNLSYREISEITGLAEGAVRTRLHRARFALKEKLKTVI
jgi:RNA polymerase sigma-70 factor (ECF subfamily)